MDQKLLIVDDDEFIRSITQEVLEQAGYEIETAEDGLDAWEKIAGAPTRYQLILLDKQMPRMNGIELLKRVKSDERFKELPVVMLTGHNQQQDIIEGLAEGAYYYLTKPSPEDVLLRVIKNALDEFHQKSELRTRIGQQTNTLRFLRRAEFRFQTLSEAKDLALVLAEASQDPDRTVNGYSELLINAVEHGNLGITYAEKSRLLTEDQWEAEVIARLQSPPYSDRMVTVVLEKNTASCTVTIIDQGNGFDWHPYLEFSPERAFDLHGRGVAMSKAMSFDNLEYRGNGNTVVTSVNFG